MQDTKFSPHEQEAMNEGHQKQRQTPDAMVKDKSMNRYRPNTLAPVDYTLHPQVHEDEEEDDDDDGSVSRYSLRSSSGGASKYALRSSTK